MLERKIIIEDKIKKDLMIDISFSQWIPFILSTSLYYER